MAEFISIRGDQAPLLCASEHARRDDAAAVVADGEHDLVRALRSAHGHDAGPRFAGLRAVVRRFDSVRDSVADEVKGGV